MAIKNTKKQSKPKQATKKQVPRKPITKKPKATTMQAKPKRKYGLNKEAQELFDFLVKENKGDILPSLDGEVLATYCFHACRVIQLREKLDSLPSPFITLPNGMPMEHPISKIIKESESIIKSSSDRLGFNPISRQKLKPKSGKGGANAKDDSVKSKISQLRELSIMENNRSCG